MKFEIPDGETLKEIGDELGFTMNDEYIEQVRTFMGPFGQAFSALDDLPDNLPAVKYPREPGYVPTGEENKYGAWAVKTIIKGAQSGKLVGRKVAIKDALCLAGVPMTGGTSVLDNYIPDMDASIVTLLLDAGAEVTGKTVQRVERLGFSHAWFYDGPLYIADIFVAMAAAAMETSRIRLGMGAAV